MDQQLQQIRVAHILSNLASRGTLSKSSIRPLSKNLKKPSVVPIFSSTRRQTTPHQNKQKSIGQQQNTQKSRGQQQHKSHGPMDLPIGIRYRPRNTRNPYEVNKFGRFIGTYPTFQEANKDNQEFDIFYNATKDLPMTYAKFHKSKRSSSAVSSSLKKKKK